MLVCISLSLLSQSSSHLTSIEEDGYSECFVELELGFEADVFQMVLSSDMADMATAIHILIAFVEVPSLLKVDLSYLKESTSSRF